jgi:hypothetical protein
MPGYDVQWHNKKEAVTSGVPKQQSEKEREQSPELASVSEAKPMIKKFAFPNLLLATDTIITKKGDTILCSITGFSHEKVQYTRNNVSDSIARTKVRHANRPIYNSSEVEKMASRSRLNGWLALFLIFPGALAFLIPLVVGIPLVIIANKTSLRATKEINKQPEKYSDAVKKKARFGRLAAKIVGITGIILLAAGVITIVTLFVVVIVQEVNF